VTYTNQPCVLQVEMLADAESSSGENQEEQLQELTDEQLEHLLHETLLVRRVRG